MKIFWSWQSDTPEHVGKYVVRDALKVVIEGSNADLLASRSFRVNSGVSEVRKPFVTVPLDVLRSQL